MSYIKIVDNVVVQKQPNAEVGFVEAPDTIICGMIHDGTGGHDASNFSDPTLPAPTWDEVRSKQRAMIVIHQDTIEIHEREVAHAGTVEADYTITPSKYQEYLTYFQTIRSHDEATHASPSDAMVALLLLEAPA